MERPSIAQVTDDEGVRHRLWMAAADDPDQGEAVARLLGVASAGPITVADGHHRYETALRYRAERTAAAPADQDPPYDYIFGLVFDTVRDGPAGADLLERAAALFEVEPWPDAGALAAAFAPGAKRGAAGQRLGLVSGNAAALLRPRRDALEPLLPPGSETLRWLDVTVLAVALERLLGIDAAATAAGRLDYTKDAAEAVRAVASGAAGSAFLLDPTPVEAVARVAEAGELMPQKSTYFYPKPVTGLLFSPGRW
jgi:uncharacterized protein (DUF1015 family)